MYVAPISHAQACLATSYFTNLPVCVSLSSVDVQVVMMDNIPSEKEANQQGVGGGTDCPTPR